MKPACSPFGDISLETFLREYWQKKPLLIRNAFPDFQPPVSADELAGLACEEEVESRLILQSPTDDRWELKHGPFDEATFAALPHSHWTLLVQAVDHWVPEAAALIEQFRFVPNWRIDDLMISYASDGGGVGPHYDNYDVFLIQAEGQRCWEIGGLYDEHSPRRPELPVMILPHWEAEQSWILNPGDMLYLPPRVGHNGYALGDGCMTYSVGFRAPSHQEMLAGFVGYLDGVTGAEDRYSDPDLEPQANPGEISAQALQRVRQILQRYSDDPALLGSWFGRFMTEPKYPDLAGSQGEELSAADVEALLASGCWVHRNEGSRFAFRQDGQDRLSLFVDGQQFECNVNQAALARQLCCETSLQLPADPDTVALVGALLRQGSLYIE